MHYPVVFISNNFTKDSFNNTPFEILFLKEAAIIDNYELIFNNQNISFDYLITDSSEYLKKMNIEFDGDCAITNYFLQTSVENVFAIGNANSSKKNITDQFEIIIEYIINPE